MITRTAPLATRAGHLFPPERNRRRRLLSTSVLITGGAGFIGSALTRRLIKAGYDVAVMEVLHPQVHGERAAIDLPPSMQLFIGDVTHAPDWDAVLGCSDLPRSSIWRPRRERRSRSSRRRAMVR